MHAHIYTHAHTQLLTRSLNQGFVSYNSFKAEADRKLLQVSEDVVLSATDEVLTYIPR